MASRPPTSTQIQSLVREIQQLRVRDLSEICASLGLARSGVKAEIQGRIIAAIQSTAKYSDGERFQSVLDKVHKVSKPHAHVRNAYQSPAASASPSSGAHATGNMAPSYNSGHSYGAVGGSRAMGAQSAAGLHFKRSPFYDIESSIGNLHVCEPMTQHRNSVNVNLKASTFPGLQKCGPNSPYRVLIFSAEGNTGIQDIAFPHACEIKVNKDDVKANTRGIKNKRGSTRPVDITSYLRLKPTNYHNMVDFTYALTTKSYYMMLYLCRVNMPSDLVKQIEKRSRISKASVIHEITRKANADPDIEATSTTLSLKCPLSGGRIKVPIRATSCKHISCFDALSFLQLQEQAPLWVCPQCSNPAVWDNLAIDEYIKDILVNTSSSVDAVTVEPDGRWRVQSADSQESRPRYPNSSTILDEDDDFSVVSDQRIPGSTGYMRMKSESGPDGFPHGLGLATPRESSKPATPSTTNKRPRNDVIDLTLDSDEEDLPVVRPAAKRVNYGDYGAGSNDVSY